jgi:putative radical SAM enzyme (TIGR03279 family)
VAQPVFLPCRDGQVVPMIQLAQPFPPPVADLHAWREGDAVVALDGRPLADVLDFYYYVPDGEDMRLTIRRATGEEVEVAFPPEAIDAVTGAFAPMEFKTCACNCVFCFIDQNPRGMRPQIYVKDEDYRFSFLYGNYITLTSLGRKGLARIIEQRMSPLFVSVHATDIDVRTRMLGIRRRIDVVQILRALVENGIEVHTQVVLCPGWNDGAILERTYRDLVALAPRVGSLAVVPVGLSAHRDGLTRLDPVTPKIARAVIGQVEGLQAEARRELGGTFIHLSDEFYLLADLPFPAAEAYEDFPQVDNGIGLTVQLRERWLADLEKARADGVLPARPLTILTGELAARAFRRDLAPALAAAGAPALEVVGVGNRFYGESVTVAGLLSGADLRRALRALPARPHRTVVLSPRVFNADDLTLDGMTLAEIAAAQPHEVLVPGEDGFVDFWIGID